MKAVLNVPDRGISFELDNFKISIHNRIERTIMLNGTVELNKLGEPVTLITNNVPEVLLEKIVALVENYCSNLK